MLSSMTYLNYCYSFLIINIIIVVILSPLMLLLEIIYTYVISSANLDPVSNFLFDDSSRTFLWNRPPTLNGISVYYSIQLNYSDGTSIYNADTSIQNYTLPMNLNECSLLIFTVIAKADELVSNVTNWTGPSHGMTKPNNNYNILVILSYVLMLLQLHQNIYSENSV